MPQLMPIVPAPTQPVLKLFYQLTGCYDLTDRKKTILVERVTTEDLDTGRFEKVTNDFVLNHQPKDYGNIGWLLTNLERARHPAPHANGNGHKPPPLTPAERRNARIAQ